MPVSQPTKQVMADTFIFQYDCSVCVCVCVFERDLHIISEELACEQRVLMSSVYLETLSISCLPLESRLASSSVSLSSSPIFF